MNSLVCSVASYVVNSLWQVPLVGGAGWVASRLLKKLGPQAQHVAWVATLALSVLAPAFPFCRALLSFSYLPNASAGQSAVAFVATQNSAPSATGLLILPHALILTLFCLYLCALLYFAARLAWSMYWTAALLRNTSAVSLEPEKAELWNRCKQAFSVENAAILSSPRVNGPVTVGFTTPIMLVPAGFAAQCTPHDFLTALGHECAHMQRRDFQKNLLYEALTLVIAFHPVIWLLKAQIAQTREMICDAMTVEELTDSHSYTQSLLRLAAMMVNSSHLSAVRAIGIFDANILEKRIMYMKTKKQNLSVAVKCGLILPAVLLLCSVAAAGAAMATGVDSQSPSQPSAGPAKPYGHVYTVGGDVTPPKPIFTPEAVYPESARKSKTPSITGVCLLQMVVDRSGMPRDVRIARSLGPDFDQSALKAVRQYRFSPARRSGKPVAVAITIEVTFKLYGEKLGAPGGIGLPDPAR
jgi:TonB family protein